MKNLFLSFVIVLLTVAGVKAQSSTLVKMYSDVPNKTAAQKVSDTLANATTDSQTAKIDGYYDAVSVQAQLDKISGTAAGKVFLRGSLNGTSFDKVDSLTVANVTQQTKIFNVSPSKYVFYQIQFVGGAGATQSVILRSMAVARKR